MSLLFSEATQGHPIKGQSLTSEATPQLERRAHSFSDIPQKACWDAPGWIRLVYETQSAINSKRLKNGFSVKFSLHERWGGGGEGTEVEGA